MNERAAGRNTDLVETHQAKAFETLLYLVDHAGELCDKRELMAAVWPGLVVEETNLNQNISALRRAFGERAGENRYIVTVPGRGYRFVPAVRSLDTTSTDTKTIALLAFADLSAGGDQKHLFGGYLRRSHEPAREDPVAQSHRTQFSLVFQEHGRARRLLYRQYRRGVRESEQHAEARSAAGPRDADGL